MKRDALAIIIHPYKNILVPEMNLRESINIFAENILDITDKHNGLKLNLVLPAYFLQYVDPLTLSRLREIQKRDSLEWLSSGYTEPFLSFSPHWLSASNIKFGIDVFEDMVAYRPEGYAPPFSNWEPSMINLLRNCGNRYALVSKSILPKEVQNHCGYWIAEDGGSTISIFPASTFHYHMAPKNINDWIDKQVLADPDKSDSTKLIAIEYFVPLIKKDNIDPYPWIQSLADASETFLLKYRTIRLQDFPNLASPRGLQYIPSTLAINRNDKNEEPYFFNYLHTFDQVGIVQRKMMDVADNLEELNNVKDIIPILKELYLSQDINRYMPAGVNGGFTNIYDRLWTYSKLIGIENVLHKRDKKKGGQIRIADYLRNGTKCIILSNKSIKLYIDYKNGGQIFELDYRERNINICAVFKPKSEGIPRIISFNKTRAGFMDFVLEDNCVIDDFKLKPKNTTEFTNGYFDYKVKKTNTGAKAILSRQGRVTLDSKDYPLFIEKVFGLEGDISSLSFAYQLSNHSLTEYSLRFAIETTFSLLGIEKGLVEIVCEDKRLNLDITKNLCLENITSFKIQDSFMGVSIEFSIQKPIDIWIIPIFDTIDGRNIIQGLSVVISSKVFLGENAVWSLMGKIQLKKIRIKGEIFNEI